MESLGTLKLKWPYPIRYDVENEIDADVLVLGGGVAGTFASISASRKGMKVALIEKSATIRSGGAASGIDHWHYAATNPASKVTPEELTEALIKNNNGWTCGLATYIQCSESYDALLDLEKMGMKIRDTEGEFKGADFRDEQTQLLFAYDYKNKFTMRIWGTGMKPALYHECKRLGVAVYDRIMVTSLLTAGGQQGAKVIGATGVNVRTGEFYIFKAKATVLCLSRPARLWIFDSEHVGLHTLDSSPVNVGDGHAIAWRAGVEFAMMEKSRAAFWEGLIGFGFPAYSTGHYRTTWFPCRIVDSKGKEVPWVNAQGEYVQQSQRAYPVNVPNQKFIVMGGGAVGFGPPVPEFSPPYLNITRQEDFWRKFSRDGFIPPFYADLPSMPEHERRVIFGLMVGQEGLSHVGYRNLTAAGFDPVKHMLQMYPERDAPAAWRVFMTPAGGVVPDWNLRSNLEGLYGAGRALLGGADCSSAATTGRYAGRQAAAYARGASAPVINRKQVEREKTRIYASIRRKDGINWKELNAGICKIMQDYCSDIKTDELLNVGLKWFKELKEGEALAAFARNPHELMHILECSDMISCGELVMHQSLARKASSVWLNFERPDYPEKDPPAWHKFVTVKLQDDGVIVGERPINYWGSLKDNYESHCGL